MLWLLPSFQVKCHFICGSPLKFPGKKLFSSCSIMFLISVRCRIVLDWVYQVPVSTVIIIGVTWIYSFLIEGMISTGIINVTINKPIAILLAGLFRQSRYEIRQVAAVRQNTTAQASMRSQCLRLAYCHPHLLWYWPHRIFEVSLPVFLAPFWNTLNRFLR